MKDITLRVKCIPDSPTLCHGLLKSDHERKTITILTCISFWLNQLFNVEQENIFKKTFITLYRF